MGVFVALFLSSIVSPPHSSAQSLSTPIITSVPSTVTVDPSGEFTIRLTASSAQSMNGINGYIHFDPSLLTYVSATQGTFFQSSCSVSLISGVSPNPGEEGMVIFGITTLGTCAGTSDSGAVVSFTFKTSSAASNTSLSFSDTFVYQNWVESAFTLPSIVVTIGNPAAAPTPIPATPAPATPAPVTPSPITPAPDAPAPTYVYGCMDSAATNYNPLATSQTGVTCIYPVAVTPPPPDGGKGGGGESVASNSSSGSGSSSASGTTGGGSTTNTSSGGGVITISGGGGGSSGISTSISSGDDSTVSISNAVATATTDELPQVSTPPSVYLYLSQAPYTGLELGLSGTLLYWGAFIAFILAFAYLVLYYIVLRIRRLVSNGALREGLDTKSAPWYTEQYHMNTFLIETFNRKTETAVTGLAVVGFISLVAAGMWLAVYSTRFVPDVVNGIGTAAVYIGSVFTPESEPSLSIVSTPTTIFFGEASTTSAASTVETTILPKQTKTTAGANTSGVYQIGGVATTTSLYGLPDLVVNITAVGYLAAASADSFIASSTIPADSRPAVRFTIKNIGTNVTGAWRFSVSIPTQSYYIYQSQLQQSLAPGDSIDYTLGFDQAIRGSDKMISVTTNFDHAVTESNFDNNSDSTKVTILGN
ncbi:MAG: cohesin domain-containing protein [Candidatus Paceibacterota bacterium]